MKILITGGAGYIGTALCDALDADPTIDRITVYDALIRGDHRFLFRSMPYQKVHFLRETFWTPNACNPPAPAMTW
jgi:nucleoside-diphosphate-sugar epimerase